MMRCLLMTIIHRRWKMTWIVHSKWKMKHCSDESNHKQQLNWNQYQLSSCEKWQWYSSDCRWDHKKNQTWKKLRNHLINIKYRMNRTINTALLWTTPNITQSELSWMFSFNWRRLDNWVNMRVVSSNHDDIWNLDFNTYNTPLEDWWWVLWKYYRTKTINIWISVRANSENELNTMIDEIKYRTSFTEWNLRIVINDVVRERTATCTALKFNRKSFNVNWIWNVQLTFTCVNPHSHLLSPNVQNFISQTWTYSWWIVYDWRAESYPKLFINIDSWTSNWMSFTLNWYKIEIETTLFQWDIILFDWEKKSVKVNDVEIAYDWPFTPLTYGENLYSISNDATYTWTLSFFTKYL